jgi:hypothetical protein
MAMKARGQQEGAAERRAPAQHVEQARRCELAEQRFRLARARQREAVADRAADLFEHSQALLPEQQLARREPEVRVIRAVVLPDRHQAAGIAEGQRLDQGGVDDAEDRGVGASEPSSIRNRPSVACRTRCAIE